VLFSKKPENGTAKKSAQRKKEPKAFEHTAGRLDQVPEEKRSALGVFRMFVPSLSW
jgi:hypothetical protein